MVGNLVLANWVVMLMTKVYGQNFILEEPRLHEEMLTIGSFSPSADYFVWSFPWSVLQEHHRLHRIAPNSHSAELNILLKHSAKAILEEMQASEGLAIIMALNETSRKADEASI